MLEYNRIDISEGIDVNKTSASEEGNICHYCYFKDIVFKYEPYLCNGIYNIGYITIKKNDDCENIYCVNPLYLLVNHASEYVEEKNANKYLIFNSSDENKELLKKYPDVWSGIKNKIEVVSGGECDYGKGYMKIKFNFDDDLPLNKPLKFHMVTITIRSVFEEDGKLYPRVFLDDALYELSI